MRFGAQVAPLVGAGCARAGAHAVRALARGLTHVAEGTVMPDGLLAPVPVQRERKPARAYFLSSSCPWCCSGRSFRSRCKSRCRSRCRCSFETVLPGGSPKTQRPQAPARVLSSDSRQEPPVGLHVRQTASRTRRSSPCRKPISPSSGPCRKSTRCLGGWRSRCEVWSGQSTTAGAVCTLL